MPARLLLTVLVSLSLSPVAMGQGCAPGWEYFPEPLSWGLGVFDDGQGSALYAALPWRRAHWSSMTPIARKEEAEWVEIGRITLPGTSFFPQAYVFHEWDDGTGSALYLGGDFDHVNGVEARSVARWDGATWTPLGAGLGSLGSSNPYARCMATFDDGTGEALYVGGWFQTAGAVPAIGIARWDGSSWSSVGVGTVTTTVDLALFNDGNGERLYACGWINAESSGVARWDGHNWTPIGITSGGKSSFSYALAVIGKPPSSNLFMAGCFDHVDGVQTGQVARWDGTGWHPTGAVSAPRCVTELGVLSDEQRTALYAGGDFTSISGVPASRVARWDGQHWSGLGPGSPVGGYVLTMRPFDDGSGPALWMTAWFEPTPGQPVGLASYRRTCEPCYPDCNDDGQLNLSDFGCFTTKFALADPYADCNGDAALNLSDFGCFTTKFALACP